MADKAISQLTEATEVQSADLFVLEQTGVAKKLTGQTLMQDLATALDGHGGIANITYTAPVSPSLDGTLTITLADNTSYTLTVTNGNGIAGVVVSYGISTSGTNPALVQSWSSSVTPPTNQYPYLWTRLVYSYKDGTSTTAYSVTVKADDTSVTIGTVSATPGQTAAASVTNSGTANDPILDFSFTLPQGDKGDTGDYIVPVMSYGTSTAAATEPSTWYSSPSSLSYTAGNFIWQKTEYTLHDAQTVQSTEKKIIGYIGANGSGSGTVQQITFNGTVYADDGTGNVPMTVDAADVGAIADPTTKSNGQVLTYDSNADEWVAANPSTGGVNTVNNKGVDTGTTNITLYASDIKMSSGNNTAVSANFPTSGTPADLGVASNGSATTFARSDHVHKKLTDKDIFEAPAATTSTYPTTVGIFAVIVDIFANLTPSATYGMLEIIKCSGYQRHLFVDGNGKAYIGFVSSVNGVTEPSTWTLLEPIPKTGSITTTTSWTTQTDDYTQTVTVSGATVTANSKVDIQPDTTALTQMLSDGCTALYVENNAGTLTLHALGTAPTVALTIQCTVTEVA